MRNIFFLVIFSCFIMGLRKTIPDTGDDKKLFMMIDSLPANWMYSMKDASLIFYCRDSVYIDFVNHINEPYMAGKPTRTDSVIIREFNDRGVKKSSAFVRFKRQPRWTKKQWDNAMRVNRNLAQQIAQLPAKHKIEKLRSEHLSSKGNPEFVPITPEDEKKVEAYRKEARELGNKLIKVPDYCTDLWSLFLTEENGRSTGTQDVYPSEISRQLYHIFTLLTDYCPCR